MTNEKTPAAGISTSNGSLPVGLQEIIERSGLSAPTIRRDIASGRLAIAHIDEGVWWTTTNAVLDWLIDRNTRFNGLTVECMRWLAELTGDEPNKDTEKQTR